MEWRKRGNVREPVELQQFVEMRIDIFENALEAPFIQRPDRVCDTNTGVAPKKMLSKLLTQRRQRSQQPCSHQKQDHIPPQPHVVLPLVAIDGQEANARS